MNINLLFKHYLDNPNLSGPPSPSNLSSVTLVGSTGSGYGNNGQDSKEETPTEAETSFKYGNAPTSPLPERVPKRPVRTIEQITSTINTITTSIQQAFSPAKLTTTSSVETPKNNNGSDRKFSSTSTVSMPPISISSPCPSISCKPKQTISPPHIGITFDRRPSAGCNIIPHAALCQHRHSLQLNGEGAAKAGSDKTSPRLPHRKFSAPKTPDRPRKSFFGTPQREPPRFA